MQLERILTSSVKYKLFSNNLTPDRDTVLGDITPATWTGSTGINQSWSDYTTNGVSSHNGYAIAPPIDWTNGSGGDVDVYGYYVTDTGATKLLAVARFDGAPVTIVDGGSLSVVPVWGDFSQAE